MVLNQIRSFSPKWLHLLFGNVFGYIVLFLSWFELCILIFANYWKLTVIACIIVRSGNLNYFLICRSSILISKSLCGEQLFQSKSGFMADFSHYLFLCYLINLYDLSWCNFVLTMYIISYYLWTFKSAKRFFFAFNDLNKWPFFLQFSFYVI